MKVAVYIGRFQPFHYGHKAIIDKVVELGYDPYILIGTTGNKNERNPLSFSKIYDKITGVCPVEWTVIPRPLYDCNNNATWVKQIDDLLAEYTPETEYNLVIHNKPSEAGKYGLPEGQFISDFILTNSTKITGSIDLSSMETPSINATDIRNSMTELLKLAPKSSLQTLLAAL